MAEKTNLSPWPALDLQGAELPREIAYSRAVWGKAHGVASEFRWIATGAKFEADAELESELGLGSEDEPAKGLAWRSLNGLSCAVGFYPSRARDAAGRTGFLEKQVLVWKRPPEMPAALAALLLLPLAAQANDEVWWDRHSEPRLHDPDFRLDLPPELEAPLQVDAKELEERLENGRRQLVEQVGEAALATIYSALLAGCKSIPLELREPLSAEALAALFLPLPRSLADRLSLAGGLPSTRADAKDLARRWDVVATDRPTVLRPSGLAPIGPRPSADQQRQGRQMASALGTGATPPERAPSPAPPPPPPTADEVEVALWGPVAAGKTVLLAQLYMGHAERFEDTGWKIFPTESSAKFGKSMRDLVTLSNRFPTATPLDLTERLVYRFHKPATDARASLVLEDRAGGHSEQLDDHARERLSSAHGLVLIFDPHRDPAKFEVEIQQTLEEVHLARQNDVLLDDRPIAACISKADLLIKTAEDARFATTAPDTFVRQRVASVDRLIRALDRFCTNYQLFPVSAAGLRLRHGAIEPTVFYDESLDLRIRGQSLPFNLLAPFAWVLDQVTAP